MEQRGERVESNSLILRSKSEQLELNNILIPIPHLPERTVLSYCWGTNVAAIGATQVPVDMTSDELLA